MHALAAASMAALFTTSAYGRDCSDTVYRDGFEELGQNRFEVELVITGLGTRSASFQLNGGETLTAIGDGSVCFAEQVQGGQGYSVAITEQPATGDACMGELTGVATARVSIPIACTSATRWDEFNWDEADWEPVSG